jgi:hypothetical protein
MRKIIAVTVLILFAGLAARMAARAARRDPGGLTEVLWLVIYLASSPGITRSTPKTSATKVRVDNLVTALGTVHSGSGSTGALPSLSGGANITGGNTANTGIPGGANASWYDAVAASISTIFGGYNLLEANYNSAIGQLNGWHTVLQNAGLL